MTYKRDLAAAESIIKGRLSLLDYLCSCTLALTTTTAIITTTSTTTTTTTTTSTTTTTTTECFPLLENTLWNHLYVWNAKQHTITVLGPHLDSAHCGHSEVSPNCALICHEFNNLPSLPECAQPLSQSRTWLPMARECSRLDSLDS